MASLAAEEAAANEKVVVVSTLAGNGQSTYLDGQDTTASFNFPRGVALDNEGNVILADYSNHRIRKVSQEGVVTTLAGNGQSACVDGPPLMASFNSPWGVAVDSDGNVLVADYGNHRIRKIAVQDGTVSTIAGCSAGYLDGQGPTARFQNPWGVAVDDEGNILVADYSNHRIRKISEDGTVSTLAGNGSANAVDGQGTQASFNGPCDVAVDADGNVIVCEYNSHRIRRISAEDGSVSLLAGNGARSFQDGPSANASFNSPSNVAVDGDGNVVVCDYGNHSIRVISREDGTVTTLAGTVGVGFVDGPASDAKFNGPWGAAIDSEGNIVVLEYNGHRLRYVTAGLTPPANQEVFPLIQSSFRKDMLTFMNDTKHTDVTFVVEGEQITGHRGLLAARSQYFQTLLGGPFREGQSGKPIEIKDASASAFRAVLGYLYTDELSFDTADIVPVMTYAQLLGLDRVVNFCLQTCRRELGPQNAVIWCVQAQELGLDDLHRASFAYVSRNLRRIKKEAKHTLEILCDHPRLMLDLLVDAA